MRRPHTNRTPHRESTLFVDIIAELWDWWEKLSELEPPLIVEAGKIPPVTEWPRRKDPSTTSAVSDEVLTGLATCAGVATGRAHSAELQPGEILTAPWTDPGLTPSFTSPEAVLVKVGSSMSHAAIVSRELGFSCVPGVKDATKRVVDGAMPTVDGGAGTVTVLEAPAGCKE
ncbi:PEP-utilizing enzyme [Rhodococcus jostii]|uniref:PEP-utilizing enzyme n=1 Tax=Rhodococcus jostii TaxID=132919 RepID=UPI003647974F